MSHIWCSQIAMHITVIATAADTALFVQCTMRCLQSWELRPCTALLYITSSAHFVVAVSKRLSCKLKASCNRSVSAFAAESKEVLGQLEDFLSEAVLLQVNTLLL